MHELSDRPFSSSRHARDLLGRLELLLEGQDFHLIEQLADEAVAASSVVDDDALRAVAAECRAQADYHLGRYAVALRAFGEATQRWRTVGDVNGEARTRLGQAGVLSICGLASESLETAHAAFTLLEDDTDLVVRIGAMLAVARGQTVLRAFDDADHLYRRALDEARARGDDRQIVRVLVDLGYFYCERSRQARAMGDRTTLQDVARRGLDTNQEALRFLRANGPSKLEWIAAANLGESQMDMGRFQDARATIETMLDSVRSAPAPSAYCEGEALLSLGQISLAEDHPEQAADELGQALAIARRDGMNELVMRSYELLTVAYERRGDYKAALDHHKHYFAVHVEILSEAARLRAAAIGYQLETVEAQAVAAAERKRASALVDDNRELQRESLEDALTGLPNHRAFLRAFDRFIAEHRDEGEFFLAVIDVDHFKAVNDAYSHSTGNEVLKALGRVLRDESRDNDFAARYGGEEFAMLLPARSRDKARTATERIRRAIEAYEWEAFGRGLAVTVSIGLVGSHESMNPAQLFDIADRRLYRAKREGRNRVVVDDA